MKLPPIRLRARLERGETVAGTALASFSTEVMDVAGIAGLDFVRVDHEHAFRRDATTESLVRVALARGVAVLARIDRSEMPLASRLLEIGAEGVIVAGVRSAEDARDAVRATRFPPMGERGFSMNCVSAGWGGADPAEWIAWSNREPLVGVTVEHPASVERIDAIVATQGLDFVQFGWADYSVAIGLPAPDKFHPQVSAARARVFAAARAAGRHVMMGVESTPQATAEAVRLGARMLEFGRDLAVLLREWRAVAALTSTRDAGDRTDRIEH
jgi:2-keto-3-deoxy-L-rhamnonate aldolase RhmA